MSIIHYDKYGKPRAEDADKVDGEHAAAFEDAGTVATHTSDVDAHHPEPTASPTASKPLLMNANAKFPTHTIEGSLTVQTGLNVGTTGAGTGVIYASSNIQAGGWLQAIAEFYHRLNIQVHNKAGDGWIVWATRNPAGAEVLIDLSNIGDATINGPLTAQALIVPHQVELTLNAAGEITVGAGTFYSVDTFENAAADDCVAVLGGTQGQFVILRTASAGRDVTFKDQAGLGLAGDFAATDRSALLFLLGIEPGVWLELSRSAN